MIAWFGLEGTFRGYLSCSEQGHLQLDQVAQSPVQPGLECFQGKSRDPLIPHLEGDFWGVITPVADALQPRLSCSFSHSLAIAQQAPLTSQPCWPAHQPQKV